MRSPYLTEIDRHQLLVEWNDTKADYPIECLHELIEEQVEQAPDAVAVICEDEELTYRELNRRANQLGHYLQGLGVGPDILVGICFDRSWEMVVGLLAVLKAGGAYVPLDPQYPDDRLALMVEDSNPRVLLTLESLRSKFSRQQSEVVCLDLQRNEIFEGDLGNCRSEVGTENLAYVIYTSGSTGKPKGVMIPHRAICNHMEWMKRQFPLHTSDRVLQKTPFSFDASVWEFYAPLLAGAQLVMARPGGHRDCRYLIEVIVEQNITILQLVPSLLHMLLQEPELEKCRSLRRVFCGGEALSRELVKNLFERLPVEMYNLYGPTEVTIDSLSWQCQPGEVGNVPIGRPVANTQAYVLDESGKLVVIGEAGELYLGGEGLARGYLNQPELTAEKFVPNLFGEAGTRLYRTGDIVRWLPEGTLEYLGRADHQVKVRGFRVELGEIETALNRHPRVDQTVIVAREDRPGDQRLVAYVVPTRGSAPEVPELRKFLTEKLPEHMVPSAFIVLDRLPLTPNGKVDRRALPIPEATAFARQKELVSPRNAIETELVKIWECVLSVGPVGVKDNFFELGGHSLLVTRLLRRIDRTFGKKLTMAAIFEGPTVEEQAAMVRNGNVSRRSPAVVPVQAVGSKPPLFCLGFHGPLFVPLSRQLGVDQPLFCLVPTLSEASGWPIPYKMEDVAASLLKYIRELQPVGPYYLGGVCVGGLMAFEAASQLVAQGEQVALLALFEPESPTPTNPQLRDSRFNLLRQRLRFHIKKLQQLDFSEALPYVRDRASTVRQKVRRLSWRILHALKSPISDGRLQNVNDILYLAASTYQPRRYSGRVVLFQGIERPPGDIWNPQNHWKERAPNLEVHETPGDHNTILLQSNVVALAEKLNPYLAGKA